MYAPDVPYDLKVSERLDSTTELRYPPDYIMPIIVNFKDEELALPKGRFLRTWWSQFMMRKTMVLQNKLFFWK